MGEFLGWLVCARFACLHFCLCAFGLLAACWLVWFCWLLCFAFVGWMFCCCFFGCVFVWFVWFCLEIIQGAGMFGRIGCFFGRVALLVFLEVLGSLPLSFVSVVCFVFLFL